MTHFLGSSRLLLTTLSLLLAWDMAVVLVGCGQCCCPTASSSHESKQQKRQSWPVGLGPTLFSTDLFLQEFQGAAAYLLVLGVSSPTVHWASVLAA